MIKKDHHYIAETYLDCFSNAEGKVCMYRKDDPNKVIQQRPKELASHRHFYRQPVPDGGFDHNSLEDLFSKVETKWPDIVRRLTQKEDVNNYLQEIFQFIAMHRARVPATRDACEAMLAAIVKSEARLLDRAGKLPPMPQGFEHLWDLVEVSIDPHQSIHAMVDVLRGMTKVLGRIGIGALHNTTGVPFLTSDNPVIWFDPAASEGDMRPYTIRDDGPIAMLFPVSPNMIIYGHSSMHDRFARGGFGYGELSEPSVVERMNAQVCRFAYEAVFASVETFADLVEQYANISPVIRIQTVPTKDGDLILSRYVWGQRSQKPKWRGR
jgi:uncharacterized protein DUF4238